MLSFSVYWPGGAIYVIQPFPFGCNKILWSLKRLFSKQLPSISPPDINVPILRFSYG